ncbi:MAG: zf-HC2 domain-containing protein [Lachnospiraceae bacterium]|nr:zf-HC2 domain-containing protein [Lachnospiraceae bacterium]
MDCKQTEKMIPVFLAGQMDRKPLKEFLEHMDSCPQCMEELNIQYLVMVGTSLLEEGVSFDLQKEMHRMLEENRGKLRKRGNRLAVLLYILEVGAILAILIFLVMVIF